MPAMTPISRPEVLIALSACSLLPEQWQTDQALSQDMLFQVISCTLYCKADVYKRSCYG